MMKVQMSVPMSGPKVNRQRGDIVEVSDKEGSSLIKAGFAVLILADSQKVPDPGKTSGKETATNKDDDKETATSDKADK